MNHQSKHYHYYKKYFLSFNSTKLEGIDNVFPTNKENISFYNDSFIIGKSDIKSDNFDILYFARRDIENAIIPPFIKIIAPFAFS